MAAGPTGRMAIDVVHIPERAIDLSRQKYCSVWHSLRRDIALLSTTQSTSRPYWRCSHAR